MHRGCTQDEPKSRSWVFFIPHMTIPSALQITGVLASQVIADLLLSFTPSSHTSDGLSFYFTLKTNFCVCPFTSSLDSPLPKNQSAFLKYKNWYRKCGSIVTTQEWTNQCCAQRPSAASKSISAEFGSKDSFVYLNKSWWVHCQNNPTTKYASYMYLKHSQLTRFKPQVLLICKT